MASKLLPSAGFSGRLGRWSGGAARSHLWGKPGHVGRSHTARGPRVSSGLGRDEAAPASRGEGRFILLLGTGCIR